MKIVSPALTPSSRRPRSAVSPATPAAAATAQSTDRLGRPRAQHGVLRLRVLAAAEHLITHGYARDSFADLVHHSGGVISDVARTAQGLAPGQGPGEDLPVE